MTIGLLPPGYQPDPDVIARAADFAAHGTPPGSLDWLHDLPDRVDKSTGNDYASTQLNLPDGLVALVQQFQSTIDPADLADEGLETEPHVTVLYGLQPDVTCFDVAAALEGESPVEITFGSIDAFPAGDHGIPLILRVSGPSLHRLHALLEALPHTSTFPTYQPHLTLAYLRPDSDTTPYLHTPPPLGGNTTINTVTFSTTDGEQVQIPLVGS